MIGDFFTKPLHGSKFRKFRNIVMNCEYDEFGPVDPNDGFNIKLPFKSTEPALDKNGSSSQECVGLDSEWKMVKNRKSCGTISRQNYIDKPRVSCHIYVDQPRVKASE